MSEFSSRYTYTFHSCDTGYNSERSTLNGSAHVSAVVYPDSTASMFIGYNELEVSTGNLQLS